MPGKEGEDEKDVKEEVKEKSEEKPLELEERGKDEVVLSRAQYEAVLDRIAELEAQPARTARSEDDIDSLAAEGRSRAVASAQQVQRKDPDDMSNKEIVDFIMSEVSETGRTILTEVQTLKVLREIDKCESKYDDFWDYEKEVYKVASSNPTLSIEQAYKLAKEDKADKKKGEGEEEKGKRKEANQRTATEKLFNLPSRDALGEKPRIAADSTKRGGIVPLKEAAEAAWEEINKRGKT